MFRVRFFLTFACVILFLYGEACTIVAVSGRVTGDGRPMLLKNRDGNSVNVIIKIGRGVKYTYLCQCLVPDGEALSGFNERGFSIVDASTYNLSRSEAGGNAHLMQLALENCATLDDFEQLFDSLPKPANVCANFGVMDALGNVAIYEASPYTYTKYNADSVDCGYLIRTNFSFSADTTGVSSITPSSLPRFQIVSNYLEETVFANGSISKEDLLGLSRCLVNRDGINLCDIAPFDEYTYSPVDFRFYVPRYTSTSSMVIQGVLPDEQPKLTVAWTMVGPPLSSITVPYLITPQGALPQKVQMGSDGKSWFCQKGQHLKNYCFVNRDTLDLSRMYNLSGTGIMQKIYSMEKIVLGIGDELIAKLRTNEATCFDVEAYYSWVDSYVEEQYENNGLLSLNSMERNNDVNGQVVEYYDLLGRPVKKVRNNVVIKRIGNKAIILK